MAEELLPDEIVGTDVEHVNRTIGIKGQITKGRSERAGQVDAGASREPAKRVIGLFCVSGIKSKRNEQNVPRVRMYRKGRIRIAKPACVAESKYAGKQSVIH